MFRKLWDYFLLTMGITPKGAEPPVRKDKWADAKRMKEAEQRAKIEREDRQAREGAEH